MSHDGNVWYVVANQDYQNIDTTPFKLNDLVITASHHRRDFSISICKIVSVNKEEKTAELETINSFSRGEWDVDLQEYLVDAVEAAKAKATCYHCRNPHFIKEE